MRPGNLVCSVILCVVHSAFAQNSAPAKDSKSDVKDETGGRPWVVAKALEDQFREKEKDAGKDKAKLVELAAWCASKGLQHRIPTLLVPIEKEPEVAEVLGFAAPDPKAPASTEPPLLDAPRFLATPRTLPSLAPTPADKKKKLLQDKDRSLKPPKPTTYFDLISDLDTPQLDIHSKMLNDYFRGMKNRFRAYLQTNVDVLIFANRSDYMHFYHWVEGETGENVLGFYLPKSRSLYFYDDPYNRDEIALTARHECTHLLLDISYGSAPLPRWFHEGMACYLASDGENARGRYTMDLVIDLMAQLDRTTTKIDKLPTVDSAKFEYEYYPQSWALIYYLANGQRNELFQKFQAALRERVNAQMKPADCARAVTETLEDTLKGNFESLAKDCRAYFEKDFRISRPDQYADLAESALKRCTLGAKYGNPAKLLDIASLANSVARNGSTPADLPSLDHAALLTMLRRSELNKASFDGWRLTLRALVAGLKSLGPLTEEARVGQIVRIALADVAGGLELPGKAGEPRDVIRQIHELGAKKQGREAEEWKAIGALCEDLLEIAYQRLAKAIDADPTHRSVAEQWVFLSLEAAPSKVAEIFPLLLLLNERDPSDENTAVLGLAYIGMGKANYGKGLLQQARLRTAQPALLAEYMAWK